MGLTTERLLFRVDQLRLRAKRAYFLLVPLGTRPKAPYLTDEKSLCLILRNSLLLEPIAQ
jgi:hypothetical protein